MAKRGLGKGLGAFFGEEVTTTKENAAEKVSRSERKGHLMVNQGTTKNTEKDGTGKKTDSSQPAKTGTNAENRRKTGRKDRGKADRADIEAQPDRTEQRAAEKKF